MDGKHIFTAGSDGQLFIYNVKEWMPPVLGQPRSKMNQNEDLGNEYPRIEEHLAHIVLVNKTMMEDWRKE